MEIDIEKIINASKKGGEELKKFFGNCLKSRQKSIALDFRTKADLESEKKIIKELSNNFPNFNIFSEEKGIMDRKSEYTFFIDPLDGTSNFVLGIPNFSVSIGLARGKEIIAAVVNNVFMGHIYFAQKGHGSFMDDKKIKVNKEKDIKKANIGYDCDYGHYFEPYLRSLMETMESKNIKRLLINMSPAMDLCRVACGQLECFINNSNAIYDYAAGKLIAREAGSMITDFNGEHDLDVNNNIFLASNGTKIHREILEIL